MFITFVDFLNTQLLLSLIFLLFFYSNLFPIFFISFLLLTLDSVCSSFLGFFREKLDYWLETFFFNIGIYRYKSSLSTVLAAYYKICFHSAVFTFIYLKVFSDFSWDFFLAHWLFRSKLFNFHILVNFPSSLLLLIPDLFPWESFYF